MAEDKLKPQTKCTKFFVSAWMDDVSGIPSKKVNFMAVMN